MPARFDQPEEYWSKLKTAVREEGGVSTAVLDRDGRVLKVRLAALACHALNHRIASGRGGSATEH